MKLTLNELEELESAVHGQFTGLYSFLERKQRRVRPKDVGDQVIEEHTRGRIQILEALYEKLKVEVKQLRDTVGTGVNVEEKGDEQ